MLLRLAIYGLMFLLALVVSSTVRSARLRTVLLVGISYTLYLTWSTWFFTVLLFSTVVNYLVGKLLRQRQSVAVLLAGLGFNLFLLATFKYFPSAAADVRVLHGLSHLALPLGISFWTFQAISYLMDLYRGEELDPSLAEFGLYMAFFPTVISGPICRMPDMLPQFRSHQRSSLKNMGEGFRRIATGVLMMLLARLLGQGIFGGDGIASGFDRLTSWGATDVLFLALGFGLQLFFDFAGYSHLAIGAAKALGFTLPENFERPFASSTPSIFWTRWHMSLSFWIRDYVFLPLAVLRRETWWRNAALIVAMVAFGIWHKATLLFVLWGVYHGVLLVLHRQVQWLQRRTDWNAPEPLWTLLSWLTTIILVNLGWIFFRANSLLQVRQMFSALLSPHTYLSHSLSSTYYWLVFVLGLGYAAVAFCGEMLARYETGMIESQVMASIARNRWYWVSTLYALAMMIVLMITLAQGGEGSQLMYRNF